MKRNYLVDLKQRLHSNKKVDMANYVLGVAVGSFMRTSRLELQRTQPTIGPHSVR